MKCEGYSLWFMPGGEVRDEVKALIEKFARELGTDPFLPHVTLLGQVKDVEAHIIKKTARLANSLNAFSITLNEAAYSDEYFRCLYLSARKEPALMSANLKARVAFGKMDAARFMPHLSLVYGDIDVSKKERIITEVGSSAEYSFPVSKISLFLTSGSPCQWRHIEDFSFT